MPAVLHRDVIEPGNGALSVARRRVAADSWRTATSPAGEKKRLRRKELWLLYKYTDDAEFQRWQRNAPETTNAAREHFEGMLKERPQLAKDEKR